MGPPRRSAGPMDPMNPQSSSHRPIAGPRPPLRAAAVLLAAGQSRRMGGELSKALLDLAGRPVVERAAAALLAAGPVSELVVVVRGRERGAIEAALRPHAARIRAFVEGGEERTDSVRAGIGAVSEEVDVALVHDAARCFVAPEDVAAVAEAAFEHGCALLASRVRDTLKLSRNGFQSEETVDREALWAAETPQAMRIARFRDVLARSESDGFRPTDDAALHEHYLGPTKLVSSTRWNPKITFPADVPLGTALATVLDAQDRADEARTSPA